MVYGKYKDLKRRAQSDRILKDKAFEIASNPEYDGYQTGLASMVIRFFDKRSKGSSIKQNEQLAKELHKPIKRRKVYSSYLINKQIE